MPKLVIANKYVPIIVTKSLVYSYVKFYSSFIMCNLFIIYYMDGQKTVIFTIVVITPKCHKGYDDYCRG